MGLAEDAFDRLRRVAFEGEQAEKMSALGTQTQLSPGVLKTLVRLVRTDGISLVDDLAHHGLATREPGPVDRRVKIIVLTPKGRMLAEEIRSVLSVPPASFSALSRAELRQLRDLLDKVVAADPGISEDAPHRAPSLKATAS
jgi:DNA-binding MarR family transcriptional regulator